jgi:hypothetical protein
LWGYGVRPTGDIGWCGGRDGRFRQLDGVKQEGGRRAQDKKHGASPMARTCDRRVSARLPLFAQSLHFVVFPFTFFDTTRLAKRHPRLKESISRVSSVRPSRFEAKPGSGSPRLHCTIYSTFHYDLASRYKLYAFQCRSTHGRLLKTLRSCARLTNGPV